MVETSARTGGQGKPQARFNHSPTTPSRPWAVAAAPDAAMEGRQTWQRREDDDVMTSKRRVTRASNPPLDYTTDETIVVSIVALRVLGTAHVYTFNTSVGGLSIT